MKAETIWLNSGKHAANLELLIVFSYVGFICFLNYTQLGGCCYLDAYCGCNT